MSYSFNNPCWNCQKFGTTPEDKCTDANNIQDAVTKINMSSPEKGHKGSGMVVLMCCRQQPKENFK